MIEFEHKLPCMYADGEHPTGTYNNRELGFPSILTTTDPKLGLFLYTLRSNIYADRSVVFMDGKILICDKNWIRDHVHVMKAMRHWEHNLHSFLNFIIATQREDDSSTSWSSRRTTAIGRWSTRIAISSIPRTI